MVCYLAFLESGKILENTGQKSLGEAIIIVFSFDEINFGRQQSVGINNRFSKCVFEGHLHLLRFLGDDITHQNTFNRFYAGNIAAGDTFAKHTLLGEYGPYGSRGSRLGSLIFGTGIVKDWDTLFYFPKKFPKKRANVPTCRDILVLFSLQLKDKEDVYSSKKGLG